MENKLLIITDPGIDDALAIIVAHRIMDEKNLGFLASFGNNTLTHTFSNLQKILAITGSNSPFFAGSDRPISTKYQPFVGVHGDHGLGSLKNNSTISYQTSTFWDKKILRRESLSVNASAFINGTPKTTIISLAPLTDLSKIIAIPKIANRIDKILMMGGCLYFPGNASRSVEANFFYDPQAVSNVFKSTIPITLFTLNLTENIQLDLSFINLLNNSPTNQLIKKITPHYINYYTKHKKYYFSPLFSKNITYTGASFHDICPVLYLKFPKLFKTIEVCVSVNSNTGEIMHDNYRGEQIPTNSRKITLITSVDTPKLLFQLAKMLNSQ